MGELLMLLPIVVPVLFWAGYHYHKDRHLPEPPGNLLICFLLGGLAAVLARAMYVSLDAVDLRFDAFLLAETNPVALFAYAMLAIGPIEELSKLLPFVVVVLRFRAFNEPIDGIIYASFIGLGFAAAENLYYLNFLTPFEAVARGFASPVVHILFASIWGHWIGTAALQRSRRLQSAAIGLLLAAGLHGFYDFVVLLNPAWALPIAAVLIGAIWIWRLQLLHVLHLDAVQNAAERSPVPGPRAD
ncbi:MAG: PrsW family glutamic-type intramembrane protease [Woeseiaceae bacterium]|nr:PrsW family glutamic-type intramembrane protease [Woeseiaceae bacterium]